MPQGDSFFFNLLAWLINACRFFVSLWDSASSEGSGEHDNGDSEAHLTRASSTGDRVSDVVIDMLGSSPSEIHLYDPGIVSCRMV